MVLLVDGSSCCMLAVIVGVFLAFLEALVVVLLGGLFLSLLLVRVISQRKPFLSFVSTQLD